MILIIKKTILLEEWLKIKNYNDSSNINLVNEYNVDNYGINNRLTSMVLIIG